MKRAGRPRVWRTRGRRRAAWGEAQHARALPCPPAFCVSDRVRCVDCRPLPLSSRVPWFCAPTRGGAPARERPRRGVGGGLSRRGVGRMASQEDEAWCRFSNAPPRKGAGRGSCRGSWQRVGRGASSEKRSPTAAPGGRRRSGGRRDGTHGAARRQSSWRVLPRMLQRRNGERFVQRRAASSSRRGVNRSSSVSARELAPERRDRGNRFPAAVSGLLLPQASTFPATVAAHRTDRSGSNRTSVATRARCSLVRGALTRDPGRRGCPRPVSKRP